MARDMGEGEPWLLLAMFGHTSITLYPGSLAWDVDISLVRRVFLVKSMPTSAHTQLNCVFLSVIVSKKDFRSTSLFFFTVFEFMAGSVVASA